MDTFKELSVDETFETQGGLIPVAVAVVWATCLAAGFTAGVTISVNNHNREANKSK